MRTKHALLRKCLLVCLVLAVLPLSGCFMQPDRTLDPLTVDLLTPQPLPTSNVLPQATLMPPRETPAPTQVADTGAQTGDTGTQANTSDWLNWGGQTSVSTSGQGDSSIVSTTARPASNGSSWQTSTTDYNTGYPVLKLGSEGSDVYDLQERLKELGYYKGSLDSKFASGTQSAVIAFQSNNGLSADGIAGRATQDRLYSSNASAAQITVASASTTYSLLKSGSQGTAVRKLQVRLTELGYYNGGADGIFGSSTETAVKSFQRNNGLSGDGQAGEQTQKKLYGSSAAKAPRPVTTPDPTAQRTLSLGMEGNDVYSMQTRLIELRYLSGVADGVFGPETEAALKAFQKNNDLTADGLAGLGTLKRLAGKAKAAPTKPTATATPKPGTYAVLREGDTGQYVYDLQERLYDLSYYKGRIDGRFGPNTTAALVSFQSAHGLTADGIAGSATQTKLFSSSANINPGSLSTPKPSTTTAPIENYTVLKEGNSGEAVMRLQQYLDDLGYYSGRVDGAYGADTSTAVRQFQYYNGLTEDGIAGPSTQARLFGGTAVSLPTSAATAKPNTSLLLNEGSAGNDVKQMQSRLYQLRYLDAGYVSGTFDAATTAAVMTFQQRNGLFADGVAGSATLTALYSADAEPLILGN